MAQIEDVTAAGQAAEVRIYTLVGCSACSVARMVLRRQGIRFDEVRRWSPARLLSGRRPRCYEALLVEREGHIAQRFRCDSREQAMEGHFSEGYA